MVFIRLAAVYTVYTTSDRRTLGSADAPEQEEPNPCTNEP
jgi:hypothetical protein